MSLPIPEQTEIWKSKEEMTDEDNKITISISVKRAAILDATKHRPYADF